VLDTHELDRRPGTMRTVSLREPAPADLRTEVIGVPAGSELQLDLMLESVLEGIWVSGTVHAVAVGECARCLEPLERPFEVQIQELFAYPGHESEDAGVVEGDLIDLEPTVRDAVVTDLPLAPVCRADCPGLCPECGALLAEDPTHSHDAVDPRWAALASLAGSDEDDTGDDARDDARRDDDRYAGSMAGARRTSSTIASRDPAATTNDDRRAAGGPEEI
jgi:uncharacterized protein